MKAFPPDAFDPIFQRMIALMEGTSVTNVSANVASDGSAMHYSVVVADQLSTEQYRFDLRVPGPQVLIDPLAAKLAPGQQQVFYAAVIGLDGAPLDALPFWSLLPGSPGTIDQHGIYTAPDVEVVTSAVINARVDKAWAVATVTIDPSWQK